PDFEVRFLHGTLFMPPTTLGPTVLVFVGDATVRFTPGPETEKEQLRQYCGRTELVENVHTLFVRIHPADLYHVLESPPLERDPRARAPSPSASSASTSTTRTCSTRRCRGRRGGSCPAWATPWSRSRRAGAR